MNKQNATNVVAGAIALVQTLSAQYVSASPVPGNETVIQHIYVDNTVKAPRVTIYGMDSIRRYGMLR